MSKGTSDILMVNIFLGITKQTFLTPILFSLSGVIFSENHFLVSEPHEDHPSSSFIAVVDVLSSIKEKEEERGGTWWRWLSSRDGACDK
jgi:hypothetical protein